MSRTADDSTSPADAIPAAGEIRATRRHLLARSAVLSAGVAVPVAGAFGARVSRF